ncbi:MAG: aminoacetone oxidase family FAD-binding enzyme [Clostridia bacterium]|nr:aminoacetone oxidase family FAD-binding enzyme [Clostridia bacterium]
MKNFSVAIIGGGFSGLCLASMLGEKYGSQIAVIEGNKRVGKKILSTGNGQGNITNLNVSADFYHGDKEFAEIALKRYTNTHLIEYFSSLGLLTTHNANKVYPASYQASAILDVLRFRIEDYGVSVFTECYVTSVTKAGDFIIGCSNGMQFKAKKVVFAFGGSSGAGFLTDGKSFALAKGFNHTVTDLSPSLVQLKTEREKIKGLKGVKQEAKVGLYSDKGHVCTFEGDILFTDYGVSGNAIFSLSAYLKGIKNPTINVEFLPYISKGKLYEMLIKKCGNITCERLLVSVLPTRLALAVLKSIDISPTQTATCKNAQKIVGAIKCFSLDVLGTVSFECSQVTAGGIKCSEINPHTMQSNIVKGLYVIGEALDVDGDCGGYNLQWAFTSAAIAAEDINAKN